MVHTSTLIGRILALQSETPGFQPSYHLFYKNFHFHPIHLKKLSFFNSKKILALTPQQQKNTKQIHLIQHKKAYIPKFFQIFSSNSQNSNPQKTQISKVL